jgi:hypothetical protein
LREQELAFRLHACSEAGTAGKVYHCADALLGGKVWTAVCGWPNFQSGQPMMGQGSGSCAAWWGSDSLVAPSTAPAKLRGLFRKFRPQPPANLQHSLLYIKISTVSLPTRPNFTSLKRVQTNTRKRVFFTSDQNGLRRPRVRRWSYRLVLFLPYLKSGLKSLPNST